MKLDFVDKEENGYWGYLGGFLFVLTLGLSFKFWYERFFERTLFLNRRMLGDYIDEVGLSKPEIFNGYAKWVIDGYDVTLAIDGNRWYVFKSGNSFDCVISGFCGDTAAKKESAYIRDELIKSVEAV